MPGSNDHPEPHNPPRSSRSDALVHESRARHESSPEVSPEDYLATKRPELAADVAGKTLIYLDTNHWVNLRRVMLQNQNHDPVLSGNSRTRDSNAASR